MFGINKDKIKTAFIDFETRLGEISNDASKTPEQITEARVTNVELFINALKDAFS